MKVTISLDNLSAVVENARRCLPGKPSPLAGLSSFLIEVDSDLAISASNISVAMRAYAPYTEASAPFKATVDAGLFSDWVKGLSGSEVSLEYEAIGKRSKIIGVCGGSHAVFNQPSDPEEFPIRGEWFLPGEDDLTLVVSPRDVAAGIDYVSRSMAGRASGRESIEGINFRVTDQSWTFMATDGFRLALWHVLADDKISPEPVNEIIPAMSVPIVSAIAAGQSGPLTLRRPAHGGRLYIDGFRKTFATVLLDHKYPDFSSVFPTEAETTLIVDREEIVSALRNARAFAVADQNRLILSAIAEEQPRLVISATSENGDTTITVPATVTGPSIDVRLDSRYAADAISAQSAERVSISFNGPGKPMLVSGGDGRNKHLVMAMVSA
jgi:DNA polymerase III beta subunit